ncbi:esterase E4-like [Planococcus citri]|uniref:esterase E4-like n=1 Tax=Planococcus citri TaxID=170843 RepID=UPI0031F94867
MTEKVIVSLKEGQIRGIKQSSKFSGAEFYSFFGIPYGKPPIDSLRFKDPLKAKPWKGIYDATEEKSGCIQFSYLTYEILGSENCLFNNIHTPKLPGKNDTLKPVIINIHPGAYTFGSPHTKAFGSPEFIMHNDVVYVGIAHRLNILGFLNLGLKECSGNQGIKDILLSLQWIRENIRSFGGDPDNITLVGSSSGSEVIHVLMLAPAAKGLFHKAVLMGAYIFNPPVYHTETNEQFAREIAMDLDYDGNLQDNKKLLQFLKKQPAVLLLEGARRCQKKLHQNIVPTLPIGVFSPSIDGGNILPKTPRKLIESMARIPTMVGFSQIESAIGFTGEMKPFTEKNFKNSLRQNCFGWGHHISDDDLRLIYKEVEEFYLDGQPVEQASQATKMDIQTDIILSGIYDGVINPIASDLPSSVFVYKFEFQGNLHSNGIVKIFLTGDPGKGSFHTSDHCYWNRLNDPGDKETHQMIQTFTKLVTTFARNGDPNFEAIQVKWKPTTVDNPCYFSIKNPLEMVDGKLNNDRLNFWQNIQKKFGREN